MKIPTHTSLNTAVLTLLCAVSIYSTFSTIKTTEKTDQLEKRIITLSSGIASDKHQLELLNGYIELASNNRMASLISYHLNKGHSLSNIANNGYLNSLSTVFKQDYIEDNLYSRMSEYNNQMEFQNISKDQKLIREKWVSTIESGSHFDLRPQGRLILSSESVDVPVCKDETKPYLAYTIAYPKNENENDYIVDIKEEIQLSGIKQYRFVLGKGDTLLPFNTTHRILIDVGCANIEKDVPNIKNSKDVLQMTNR